MWLEDDLQNRKNLRKAFAELVYGDFPIKIMQFIPGWTSFYAAGIELNHLIQNKKALNRPKRSG